MATEVMGDMTFAAKLEKYLSQTGVKQAQLARDAGVSPGQITKYLDRDAEKPTRPSVPVILRISRATGIPLEYWLDDALEEPPPPALNEAESQILGISRIIGYDTAIRRLTVAPEVKPVGPTYGEMREAERKRGGKGNDRRSGA